MTEVKSNPAVIIDLQSQILLALLLIEKDNIEDAKKILIDALPGYMSEKLNK